MGARAELRDTKVDFRVLAVASEAGNMMSASEGKAVTGGWRELFHDEETESMARKAADKAYRLLRARHPKGGKTIVVLDPSLVGLISHEAIGHTVEVDFVMSGAVTSDKMGQRVASDLVTMVDHATPRLSEAAGYLPFDDEGTLGQRTVIIRNGIMVSYLHDRETAAMFGAKPTGNARAYEYSDEPLIRMRNTYVEPGEWKLEEIIEETKKGYLLRTGGSGMADANGEFTFEVQEAYGIAGGEVDELFRGVSISGNAFDVIKSVDAVSRDFRFDMGSGFCYKGQPVKVDGGGGYLRCKALLGGK